MEHGTVSRLVAQYQTELPCFSDELHGTAAVVLAGVLGALPSMQGSLGEQTIILSGRFFLVLMRYGLKHVPLFFSLCRRGANGRGCGGHACGCSS